MMHEVKLEFVLPRIRVHDPTRQMVSYDYSEVDRFNDWVKENSIDVLYVTNRWLTSSPS